MITDPLFEIMPGNKYLIFLENYRLKSCEMLFSQGLDLIDLGATGATYGGRPFVLVPDLSTRRAPWEEWESIKRQGTNRFCDQKGCKYCFPFFHGDS